MNSPIYNGLIKKALKKISLTVEKTATGFSDYAENYPVYTVGRTVTELKKNIVEALNLYNEELNLPEISENQVNCQASENPAKN